MTNNPKLYWDSCIFLKYLNNEPGSDTIETLLSDAEAAKITIFTSTITIAEVTHACHERNQSILDPATDSLLQNLFTHIKFAEYSVTIGYETRDFIRKMIKQSIKIKPKDGIHLATASWIDRQITRLDEINTYDHDLQSLYPNIIPIKIAEPHVNQYRLFK